MLPFFSKARKPGGVISQIGPKSVEVKDEMSVGESGAEAFEPIAHAMLHAIDTKSVSDLAKALKAHADVSDVLSDSDDEESE